MDLDVTRTYWMQVIGLCRFSYPAIGGFQIEHETIDERIAFLYGAARLEERFRLFETMVLPCLRAQTDPDFDFIIVIGDTLPAPYVARLQNLTKNMPQVTIHAEPPRKHRQVMKDILNAARRNPKQPCLQFRHDDDDAISVDFVARLRQATQDCRGLLKAHKSVAVDFNQGYVAQLGPEGIAASPLFRPYYVAAMGMYVQGGCPLTIMNFAHEKIPRFMPTITFSDAPMFVRSHSAFNDSRHKSAKTVDVTPIDTEQAAEFEARFALSQAHVRHVFSRT